MPSVTLAKTAACREAYREFFRADALQLNISFGYKDARPARFVGDRYERLDFMRMLGALGFVQSSDDPELLRGRLKILDAETGQAREKILNVKVSDSSVGPDDDDNRKNPFQKWKSARTEATYLAGLRFADVVFYNGHSRNGGGPDFSPPRLANAHVNYDWYRQNRPGFKKTLESLERSAQPTKWLGIFSCASEQHFVRELSVSAPRTGLIASAVLLYYADSLTAMEGALQSLLRLRCREDFSMPHRTQAQLATRATQVVRFYDPHPAETAKSTP